MKSIYYIGFVCIALLFYLQTVEGFYETLPSKDGVIVSFIYNLTKLQLLLSIGTIVLLLFVVYKFVILK
jgi:hypothetical protein